MSIGLRFNEALNMHLPALWFITLAAAERERAEKLFYSAEDQAIDDAVRSAEQETENATAN